MRNAVKLIGLDFGTTTSSAVVAAAQLVRNSVTGRTELSQVREGYRSDIVFTPLGDDGLEVAKIEEYLDAWLAAGEVRPEELFGGGALLTGLTAQANNAAALITLIRRRLGDALIATAEDPRLESWLAFMGSSAALSRSHPERPILNLDIGGGTTNLALGQAGEVRRTGSLFVGARHIQVQPGTYRIVKLSPYARALLDHRGIAKRAGDALNPTEVNAVLDFYLALLRGVVDGRATAFESSIARLYEQVPMPPVTESVIVTLSGGVGALVYAHLQGKPWPPTTCFGDLGIDLAQRIIEDGLWADQLRSFVPEGLGRAMVYGLLRHSTQISGSTVFLAEPEALPLADLPILGKLSPASSDGDLRAALDLVKRSPHGGAIKIELAGPGSAAVRELGTRLAHAVRAEQFPPRHPLVLFLPQNLGKVMGNYVTAWGTMPLRLVVVDELAVPDAQYATIGRMRDHVLPVSFYGLNERGTSS